MDHTDSASRDMNGDAVLGSFPELAEARVLVVDDEKTIREFVTDTVGAEGAQVVCVENAKSAREAIAGGGFNVALIDAHLPDGKGVDLVGYLHNISPQTAAVLITGFPDPRKAREMEDAGVHTLLTKPFTATQLLFTVYREFMGVRSRKAAQLDPDAAQTGLVGVSNFTRRVRHDVMLYARGDIPVLITGPTGTGKEIIARAIHNHSARKEKQMITINCAAIPGHLEESEFFGHAKGAFTGASGEKDGIVTCANNSTLFLDEVAELSLAMQAKLLRVLDVQEFTRVGEVTPRKVNVRFISATNKDLEEMVANGTFRNDLFYRLKAAMIITEPLATHKEDIAPLIKHFLSLDSSRHNRALRLVLEAIDILASYDWPGNVRQLKNTMDTLCAICEPGADITAESVKKVLRLDPEHPAEMPPPLSQAKLDFERTYFTAMLARHNGNITAAAAAAGMDRGNFSKKLKSFSIDPSEYRSE